MVRYAIVAIGAACLLQAAPASRPVTLDQALHEAVEKANTDDARSEVASSQLRLLEASNRWKFELRPTLGLFSFSNPAVLAASLGSSLFAGRRNAPSPIAMAGARFDVLAAELASERRRARTEIETARAFFDLLEKQQIASQFRAARAAKLRQGQELERLLQASRVTEVDRVTFQEELLSLEQQQVDIEMQRRLASVQLASLIGRLDDIESIEVDESPVAGAAFEQSLPPLEKLFESALFYRRETQLLREKIQDLRQKAGLPAAGPLEGISAGYAYLANGARDLASAARPNLLGGHTAQGGVSLSIPLRNTGERAAEKDLLLARIHALELEMRSMEEDLRSELLSMRSVVQAGMERLQLAARRLELSRQKSKMVHLRAENGLAGFAAAAGVEQAGLQAEAALVQARCAHRNSLFTLLVICGLHDQKETVQRQVAGS